MSLIDEALKRARMEAAQRAAESEDLPYPTIPRHLGPRRRGGWLVPTAVALAVIAGLLIGWLMASRGPRGEQVAAGRGGNASAAEPVGSGPTTPAETLRDTVPTAPQPTAPVESAAAPPAGLEPVPAVPPAPTGGDRPTESPAVPPRVPPTTDDPRPPAAAAAAPESAAAAPIEATTPSRAPDIEPGSVGNAPEATPPRQPPAATAVTDPDSGVLLVLPDRPARGETRPDQPGDDPPAEAPAESYVQQYPLPTGGIIELGGIAWSETGPFALINGRVVGPGSVIDAYTLERIRPGHVELTGEGKRIHLSLQ